MARRRYKVVLEVVCNMEGDVPAGTDEKLIKGYLESLNGIGTIEVLAIDPAARPIAHSITESLAFPEEAPTTKAGVRGSRADRRKR